MNIWGYSMIHHQHPFPPSLDIGLGYIFTCMTFGASPWLELSQLFIDNVMYISQSKVREGTRVGAPWPKTRTNPQMLSELRIFPNSAEKNRTVNLVVQTGTNLKNWVNPRGPVKNNTPRDPGSRRHGLKAKIYGEKTHWTTHGNCMCITPEQSDPENGMNPPDWLIGPFSKHRWHVVDFGNVVVFTSLPVFNWTGGSEIATVLKY